MKNGLALAAVLLAALLPSCGRKAASDPVCIAFVDRILKCDPSAPASMREEPGLICSTTRISCSSIDVSTPAGCSKFMGCLYDGE